MSDEIQVIVKQTKSAHKYTASVGSSYGSADGNDHGDVTITLGGVPDGSHYLSVKEDSGHGVGKDISVGYSRSFEIHIHN